MEMKRQPIGQKARGHCTDRKPDAVEAILRSPILLAGPVDPVVEEVVETEAYKVQVVRKEV